MFPRVNEKVSRVARPEPFAQLPLNTAVRFSMNALTASVKSSLWTASSH